MDLDDLDTPSLVIDLDTLERNIGEMAAVARGNPDTSNGALPLADPETEHWRSGPGPWSRGASLDRKSKRVRRTRIPPA